MLSTSRVEVNQTVIDDYLARQLFFKPVMPLPVGKLRSPVAFRSLLLLQCDPG